MTATTILPRARSLSGGSGNLPYSSKAIINLTDKPYQVQHGYPTTADGYGSEIVCSPGGYAIRLSAGGPRDFASWLVGDDITELSLSIQQVLAVYSELSDICVLLPGHAVPLDEFTGAAYIGYMLKVDYLQWGPNGYDGADIKTLIKAALRFLQNGGAVAPVMPLLSVSLTYFKEHKDAQYIVGFRFYGDPKGAVLRLPNGDRMLRADDPEVPILSEGDSIEVLSGESSVSFSLSVGQLVDIVESGVELQAYTETK